MNILHLKYAVEVASAGSISKAAEVLYMNQPNLSRAIKELEDSLGITIFDRTAKGMLVTPDGKEFLSYAKKILKQIDEVEAIYTKERIEKQRFSVCVPRAAYISEAFANFTAKITNSKRYEIFYKETDSAHVIKNLLHADYKLGIVRYADGNDKYFKKKLEEKNLTYELIAEFSYVILLSAAHPLAEKENISFADLSEYTEIAHANPSFLSLPMSAVKKEELPDDIEKRIYVFDRASQFDVLSYNTDSLMWVSPLPEALLNRYGLVQKQCKDNQRHYRDLLVYRNDYTLSQLDRLFITELCASKRRSI